MSGKSLAIGTWTAAAAAAVPVVAATVAAAAAAAVFVLPPRAGAGDGLDAGQDAEAAAAAAVSESGSGSGSAAQPVVTGGSRGAAAALAPSDPCEPTVQLTAVHQTRESLAPSLQTPTHATCGRGEARAPG